MVRINKFIIQGGNLNRLNNKGISLVELLVVIALMGIMGSISMSGMLNWIPEHRLQSASRELYNNLQYARISAIKAGQDCYLEFNSPAEDQYSIKTATQTIKTIDLESYGSGMNFASAPAKVTFRPNGLSATAGDSTVEVGNNSGKTYSATISAAGAIKLKAQ